MKLQPEELTAITIYQVGALRAFLDREDVPLHHVKPHGVLYGMMCREYDVAVAVMKGIPKGIPVFGLAGTNMEKAANDLGIKFWAEMYGDVKYNADGMLVIDRIKKYEDCVPNNIGNAANLSIRPWKSEDVQRHVEQQITTESVTAVDGSVVELPVKDYPISICCHSDSPGCIEIVKTTRATVDKFNQQHGWT